MNIIDWLNSFLGKKEDASLKLEPDGIKEFENNEDLQIEVLRPISKKTSKKSKKTTKAKATKAKKKGRK